MGRQGAKKRRRQAAGAPGGAPGGAGIARHGTAGAAFGGGEAAPRPAPVPAPTAQPRSVSGPSGKKQRRQAQAQAQRDTQQQRSHTQHTAPSHAVAAKVLQGGKSNNRPDISKKRPPLPPTDAAAKAAIAKVLDVADAATASADAPESLLTRENPPPGPLACAAADATDAPESLLGWLLAPVPPAAFWERYFERRPLLCKGRGRGHLRGFFCKADVDALLRRERGLVWRYNVDAVRFDESLREKVVHNGAPGERAEPDRVWELFESRGCSLRVLHPQRWSDALQSLLAGLERHFGCAVGCNAYLTPPRSQGFAPHWDDIDAFVLQLEGTKRWHVYPRQAAGQERWPRESSADFVPEDLPPPAVVTLHPGDVLYMPRGTIHEAAVADTDEHSLHVTVSSGHRVTWADFMQLALQGALATAAEENEALRRCVPRDVFDHLGVVHAEDGGGEREGADGGGKGASKGGDGGSRRGALLSQIERMVRKVVSAMPVDSAADQMCARFMAQRMVPPAGAGGPGGADATVRTGGAVRAAFAGAGRLVIEGGEAVVYHPFANPRELHMEGDEPGAEVEGALCFPLEVAPALEAALGATHGALLGVREAAEACAEHAAEEDVLASLQALVDAGVLKTVDDDSDSG